MSDYEKFCDDSGNVVVERVVVWFYEQGIQLLKDPRYLPLLLINICKIFRSRTYFFERYDFLKVFGI